MTGLLTGDTTGSMRIWDLATGKQLVGSAGHDKTIYASAFHATLPLAATGCAAGRICVWDSRTGKVVHTFEAKSRVNGMCFVGDDLLLTGGRGGLIMWDLASGRSTRPFADGGDPLYFLATHDGGNLIAASTKNAVRIWNVKTHAPVTTLPGTVYPLSFHATRPWLATGDGKGKVTLWDLEKQQKLQTLQAHKGAIKAVCFSPDGSTLATGGDDKKIRLWHVGTIGALQP